MVWLALAGVFGPCLAGSALAASSLAEWRSEASQTRLLAENDAPLAYKKAQALQARLPADATPVDQTQVLNLLSRIELYLALTDASAEHAQLALVLASQHKDRVGQAEAQLNVTLNAINQGKIGMSIAATARSMELLEGVDRHDLLGESLLRMSMMYLRLRDWDSAATVAMQAMELAKRNQDPFALVYAHHGMAVSFEQSGNYAQAREHYARMREQARAAHSKTLEGHAIKGFAAAVASLGDAVGGERLTRESLALYRSLQLPFYINHVLFGLAEMLRKQGHPAEAVRLLDEVVARYEQYPNKIGLWWSLGARSENYQSLGNGSAARADVERAYTLAKDIDSSLYRSESAKRMAAISAAVGDYARAYLLSVEASDLEGKAVRERISTRMVELAQRYETESKQREINELTRRNEQQTAELQKRMLQQRWLWTVLGGGVLVSAGTAYFVLRLRRSNRLLAMLNSQVRRSENQLQATLDAIPDPLFVLGLDGRYYDCSTPRADLLAAPVEDLAGKTIFEVLPPDAAAICQSALCEADEKGASAGKQFELPAPHGNSWFELSVARQPVNLGQEPRFIVLSRDISERKLAEEALRESEEKYRTLIQKIQAAVVVHGADTRILTSNVMAQKILGLSEDQLHGLAASYPAWHFFREDGSPLAQDDYPVNQVLVSREALKDCVLGVHRPGLENDAWVLVNADPVLGKNGEITQVIVTFVDITERKRLEDGLAAREREFRTLAENSPDPIYRYDRDCRRLYVNPVVGRILGRPVKELIGKSPADGVILVSEQSRKLMQAIRHVFDSDGSAHIDLDFVAQDGQRRIYQMLLVPERDALGQVVTVLALARDITERQRMEEALREREQRYRGVFDNVLDTLYLLEVTPDGHFRNLEVNPAFEKSSGMSSAELVGKLIEETVPEETANIVIAKYRRCVEAGTAIEEDVSLDMPSGRRHYHSTLIPVRDDCGRIHRIVGISRDVTERKQAQELLHAQEQAFRAVAENSPDNIARYDTQCRRVYVNPAMQGLFGLPVSEILGKTSIELSPLLPMQTVTYMAAIREVLESGQGQQMELNFRTRQGEANWGHMRLVPEFARDGSVASVLAVTRDITSLKATEARLEESRRLLRQLAARNEAVREDERKRISREIHDELGQYLQALRMGVSLVDLQFGADNPPIQEQTQRLVEMVDATIKVVRNVVASLRPAALDMGIVSALEWLVAEYSGRTGLRFQLQVGEEDIELDDSCTTALFRIVQESLTNVVRHAQASKVTITLLRDEANCLLEVRDDGKGFDPMLRKEKSFGLVSIRERVLMLGGDVNIASAPGQSTAIQVHIPTHKARSGS